MRKGIVFTFILLLFFSFASKTHALDVGALADRVSSEPKITMDGLGAPHCEIVTVIEPEDDKIVAVAEVEKHGRFRFEFGLAALDVNRAAVFCTDALGITARVPLSDFVAGRVLMPPTIINDKADKGIKNLALMGMTYPSARVSVSIRNQDSSSVLSSIEVMAGEDGVWKLNKSDLRPGKYVATAVSSVESLLSRSSQEIYFEIALAEVPEGFNNFWQQFWSNLSLDPTWLIVLMMPLLWLHLHQWSWLGSIVPILGMLWPLFGFKRRKKQGVVYDAVTKTPLENAIVRVREFESKKTVGFDITNSDGEFNFDLPEGEYLIDVRCGGYVFPSKLIKGKGSDGQYANIYHGEKITLNSRDTVGLSVPLDPLETINESWFYFKNFLRRFGGLISWVWLSVCVVYAIVLFVYYPTPLSIFILCYYVALMIYLFVSGVSLKKKQSRVVDEDNQPLPDVFVSLYSWPRLELVATRVSNTDGLFFVKLAKGQYILKVFDQSYQLKKVTGTSDGIILQNTDGWLKVDVILESI